MFKDKKIIIFDMDGTLIDSVGIWNQVDIELIEALGGKADDPKAVQARRDESLRANRDKANPYHEYCGYLNEYYGFGKDAEFIVKKRYEIARDYLKNSIDYKPDAEKFLKLLKEKGYTLVIASTTKRSNMQVYRTQNRNIMAKAAIDDYFAKVYTREDAAVIKPDPEIYNTVLADFNVKACECLVFEDSLVGVEAAKAAGIETAAVYDMYSDGEREEINALADHRISDYSELIEMLK